jgi:hypothetical protein
MNMLLWIENNLKICRERFWNTFSRGGAHESSLLVVADPAILGGLRPHLDAYTLGIPGLQWFLFTTKGMNHVFHTLASAKGRVLRFQLVSRVEYLGVVGRGLHRPCGLRRVPLLTGGPRRVMGLCSRGPYRNCIGWLSESQSVSTRSRSTQYF